MKKAYLFAGLLALAACSSPSSPGPATPAAPSTGDPIRDAVAGPGRNPDDYGLDAGRKPVEVLSFFGIKPGERVAELFAGGGYTTELLARIVGPSGKVYGQNSKVILEKFAEKPWSERLKKDDMKNVVRVDRELDDPLPPDATNLDAVVFVLSYHDSVWLGAKRDAMNKAIFNALKSGGVYGIVDHASGPGAGVSAVETLHRIEKSFVVSEVEAAGFKLDSESNVLANPDDKHDWNDSPRAAKERRGTSDRFVLKFVKP